MNDELMTVSYSDKVNLYFSRIANQDYKKPLEKVKKTCSKVTNSCKFIQEQNYSISADMLVITPKISSININSLNKEIVTIVFDGAPNLTAIKNILQLHSAKYKEESIGGKNPITTIKIKESSLEALAHLYTIYRKYSTEAASLIWEPLLIIVENAMDKKDDPDSNSWKESATFQLDAWANSIHQEEIPDFQDTFYSLSDLNEYYSYYAKSLYIALTDEEKEIFLEATISETVKQKTQEIVDLVDDQKYKAIHMAFNSSKKCNTYIENNMTYAMRLIEENQQITRTALGSQFEPSFWDKFNPHSTAKDVKAASSGIKSSISLVGEAAHDLLPTAKIKAAINIVSVIVSAIHFTSTGTTPSEIPNSEEINEISNKFICMSFICNSEALLGLDAKSGEILMNFYASFISSTIKKNDRGSEDLSDYLLDKISDPEYIKYLSLKAESNKMLTNKNGKEFTISDLIESQNKGSCFDKLIETLIGDPPPSSEEITAIAEGNDSTTPEETNHDSSNLVKFKSVEETIFSNTSDPVINNIENNIVECSSEFYIGLDYTNLYYDADFNT